MTITLPSGSEALVKPRRNSAFGLPPSTIQLVTLPSGPLTSIWIQEWGLIHSISVTVPVSLMGFCGSNSAAKEWCAHAGAVASNKPTPARAKSSFFISGLLLFLFCEFLFFRACAGEVVRHAVVAFVARVFEYRAVDLRHGDLSRPRRRPGSGI